MYNIEVTVELPFKIDRATLYSIVRNRDNPITKEIHDFTANMKKKFDCVSTIMTLWPCKVITSNRPSHLNVICILKREATIDNATRNDILQHLDRFATEVITSVSTTTALEIFGNTAVSLSVTTGADGIDGDELKTINIIKACDTDLFAYSLSGRLSLNAKLDKEHFIFYDTVTETLFTSTLARVMDAQINLNRNFALGADTTVQMWCDFLGIPNTKNDTRGWYLQDELYWIDFDNSDPEDIGNGIKAIVIRCEYEPIDESEIE